MTLEEMDFNSLMFFLTIFGKDLPEILKNLEILKEKVNQHPRGKLWLEKAMTLGIIRLEEGEITVNWNKLKALRESIKEALEECLK